MSDFRLSTLLDKLRSTGAVSDGQAEFITRLTRGHPFSLYYELRAVLYLGVFFLLGGIGLTIKDNFAAVGHIAIIGSLTAGFVGLFTYCFAKSAPYSSDEVPSPNLAFDYLLYLACALYSFDVSYLETHFHWLGAHWQTYLLGSSALFLLLAYRFDNKLVLALSLGTLAAWFGFKLSVFHLDFSEKYRLSAILYGGLVGAAGFLLKSRSIKAHFLNVYLNFAAHFVFAALVAGTFTFKMFSLYFLGLLVLCSVTMALALWRRRFLYMVYAILYGYVGVSAVILDKNPGVEFIFIYFIVTSIGVVVTLVALSRRFKEPA